MGPIVPELNVFNLPFMFRDNAHMEKVIDGPIGDELMKKLSDHPTAGLIGLCWMNAGSRNVYNSKQPIKTVEDLKGLKIRMMGNPRVRRHHELARRQRHRHGLRPADQCACRPASWTARRTTSRATRRGQHYRHAKYYSMTGHLMIPEILVFSKRTWQTLSKEDQALITKLAQGGPAGAAQASGTRWRRSRWRR